MSKQITKISDGEFNSLIILPKKPTVVLFTSSWSGASKTVKPIFETAAEKYTGKATFYEMDIDDNTIIPQTLRVQNVPAILTFAYGQVCGFHVGVINRDKLNESIEKITVQGEALKNMLAFSKKLSAKFGFRV
jgi:thioredoxin 1